MNHSWILLLVPLLLAAESPREAAKRRKEIHKAVVAEFSTKYDLKNKARLQYRPAARERGTISGCVHLYAQDKAAALEMVDLALNKYPKSPYVIERQLVMYLTAEQFGAAEKILEVSSKKHSDQINLKLIRDSIRPLKEAKTSLEREMLISKLELDLISLANEVGKLRKN